SAIDVDETIVVLSESSVGDPAKDQPKSPPDQVVVLPGHVEHAACPFTNAREIPTPEIEQADVEERVCLRKGVMQPLGQLWTGSGSWDGAIRVTEPPEQERRRRVRRDAGAGTETKATGLMLERVEQSNRSIQMVETRGVVAQERDARTQHQVPLHLKTDVMLV